MDGRMVTRLSLSVSKLTGMVMSLRSQQTTTHYQVQNQIHRLNNLETKMEQVTATTLPVASHQELMKRVSVMEATIFSMNQAAQVRGNQITALETTVTKELATAKALREVEAMAEMALVQIAALKKDIQMTPPPKVTENKTAVETRLMAIATAMENETYTLTGWQMREMAKEIRERIIPIVRTMK
jgi:hypothetical protein